MKIMNLLVMFAVLLLFGCTNNIRPTDIPPDAKKFNVDFSLEGMIPCKTLTVSDISINNDQVPKNTSRLFLIIEDLDFFNNPHGAKTISYKTSGNSGFFGLEGPFKLFQPFCPLPPGATHRYQLTVRALDKDNKIIGFGQATQKFPE